MRIKPIAGLVLRQLYLFRSSPFRVLPVVLWVAIDVVLWGFMTRYLNSVSAGGVDFVPTLLGGVLLWDFCTRIMHGVSTAFLEDVWSRNFLNLFASPLSISEYIAGLVITGLITSLLGLLVMLAIADWVFHLEFVSLGASLAAFLILLIVFGITLGICGSAVVLRLGPASEWLIWPLPAIFSPFCAVFYPLGVLPSWMRTISRVLPPSYVFEGMRMLLAGHALPGRLLIVGGMISTIQLGLSAVFYGHVYRHAVRTGLLARYSAEAAG